MAIASSGAIRLDADILVELGQGNEDGGGLKAASIGSIATINTANDAADRPDGSAPHLMSEFYSYDHSASSGVAVGAYGNGLNGGTGTSAKALYSTVFAGNQGTGLVTHTSDLSNSYICGSSVIGQTGHIFLRLESGTSFRQDAQLYKYNFGASNGGEVIIGKNSSVYTTWDTTSATTNEAYNQSSTWYALPSSNSSTAGRWNRDTLGTPSSSTGVSVASHVYYEGSGSSAYSKDVYLRSPEITFGTDTIILKCYGYGSNMGTLYMGVYITG